jgi:hypothetical protein
MELAFLSAIVGTFTFFWLIIHCVAAVRWPETKDAYRDTKSQALSPDGHVDG